MARAHDGNAGSDSTAGVSADIENQRRIVNLLQPCGVSRIVEGDQVYVRRRGARDFFVGQINRPPGGQGLRRLHGQSGGFEFSERGLEYAVHAAEELNQPSGSRRAEAGSQGESQPQYLVGVGFGRGNLRVGGDDGIRQGNPSRDGTMPTLSIRETKSRSYVTLRMVF